MQRPMDYDESASTPLDPGDTLTLAQRQKIDLGFESDEMEDYDSSADSLSMTGSPEKGKSSSELEALASELEVERAATVAAKSELLESQSAYRALQRKFDQLKSATSGQLAFMKKKLEAQYQNTLDGMEAELEESRDECEALRVQMQQLLEHMEAEGAAAPAQLTVTPQSSGESRHLEKLKKELIKKDEILRRYENELAAIRSKEILPAAAECAAAATGVKELQSQLAASQAEVAQLRQSAASGAGGDSSGLQAEVARLTQELRVAKMQASESQSPPPTSSAASTGSAASGSMQDLMKMRNQMASMLQKSTEAAEQRQRTRTASPTNADDSPPPSISPSPRDSATDSAALAAAQADAKAAKDRLAAEKAKWEEQKKGWREKETQWATSASSDSATNSAALAAAQADAKSTKDRLAAEMTRWEEQEKHWREKEAQWTAESEQYKQGMGDAAKDAVEKLEKERAKWEALRTEWHAKEAECKEKVAEAEAEAEQLRAAADLAAETERQLRADLAKSTQESQAALSSGQEVEQRLAEVTAARDAAQSLADQAADEAAASKAQVVQLTAEIDQIKETAESLSSQLAAEKENVATAAAAQEAAAADVVRLQAREQELNAAVEKHQSKVQNMKEQMGRAQEHMDAQQEAFVKLRSTFVREMGRVRSELSAIKASNGAIRGAAVVMKEDIGQVTPKVQKKMVKNLKQQMKAVQMSVQNLVKEKDARIAADHLEKRKLHNTIQELKGNIRVFCRARPLIGFEIEAGEQSVVQNPLEGEIAILDPKHRQKKKFEFDQVFGADATQDQIFEDTRQLIRSCCDGYNVCVFAYGQTGAGKTHTMEGTKEQPGVNYRALQELFRIKADSAKDGLNYTIDVSLLEVYCDEIRDLLTKEAQKKLEVKNTKEGTHVPGLMRRTVNTYDEVVQAIAEGQTIRATASTNMNAHSSRSHCMLQVYITGEDSRNGRTSMAKLSLVDLAGCERISRSGASGQQLKEATSINSSLSALGDVIGALSGKSKHVPYRNSKLTYLLADSLGGDSKCLMFVNVSPAAVNAGESINSLGFAARCRATELGQAKKNVSAK